jgi:hypothetical protein
MARQINSSLQKAGVRPNARRTTFCAAPHTRRMQASKISGNAAVGMKSGFWKE